MPASTCTHQISLLMWKRRLIATRSWRTTLIEMFIPLLFLLVFNVPGLSKSKPKTHASIPSVPNTTTPLGMMSSILEAPVYPSIGPFSDTYIPSKWDNSTTPGLMVGLIYSWTTTQLLLKLKHELTFHSLVQSSFLM